MTTCDLTGDGGEAPPAGARPLAPAARSAARLGLFGGSFDPVHRGHLDVAAAARAAFRLDHVVFVPAALSPHKAGLPPSPPRDRVALLERALGGLDGAGWSSIWTVELEREAPSYTVRTVEDLAQARPRGPEPYLILGEDNLPGLPTWRRVGELLDRVKPIVVQRERGTVLADVLEGVAGDLHPDHVAKLVRGLVPLADPSPHSSTAVRATLERGAEPRAALPAGVWELIRARGLYGLGAGR